jgi:RNA polymerase sigma-19 factor, ECF subfamily
MRRTVRQETTAELPLAPAALGHYRNELHRWLARRLRNPEAAEDVTQEVFLRLCRVETRERIRKPLSYLFGIAFHVISERHHSERREKMLSFDSDATALAADSIQNATDSGPEDRINLQRQLEHAFKKLPLPYQQVLLLCKRDGMTYEEAAAASGLSVHTVEKYLVRARAVLLSLTWDR